MFASIFKTFFITFFLLFSISNAHSAVYTYTLSLSDVEIRFTGFGVLNDSDREAITNAIEADLARDVYQTITYTIDTDDYTLSTTLGVVADVRHDGFDPFTSPFLTTGEFGYLAPYNLRATNSPFIGATVDDLLFGDVIQAGFYDFRNVVQDYSPSFFDGSVFYLLRNSNMSASEINDQEALNTYLATLTQFTIRISAEAAYGIGDWFGSIFVIPTYTFQSLDGVATSEVPLPAAAPLFLIALAAGRFATRKKTA